MKPLFDFFSQSRFSLSNKTAHNQPSKTKLRERTFLYGFPVKLKRSFYRTLSRIRGLGASRIGLISSFLGTPPFMFNKYLSFTKMSSVEGVAQSFFTLDRALAKAYTSALFLKRKSSITLSFLLKCFTSSLIREYEIMPIIGMS